MFQKFWSMAGQSKAPLAQSALINVGIVVQGAVMSQLLGAMKAPGQTRASVWAF
ncbi:MAG: hypothetical protein QGG19_13085 [Alphaproteobacteria bacterium]|nr:hypothetical protein [Alphaproteobacteria bacterium]MDP7056688.1 hypothetical protein [Alphaproteobacteria bacterium]MDP7227532.1 hypothetical protein [Alphaproteobacteria bacterium]